MRIGHGYDVHRLTSGRKCIICGVDIPFDRGLSGHSDADVAVHALMDAILGAAAMGDIGQHFPDNDMTFKDADSILLLKKVIALISEKGLHVSNADITIIAQKPKLAEYIPQMRENIAKAINVSVDDVNVKATTEEKLGFTGQELGICAHAVVLLA